MGRGCEGLWGAVRLAVCAPWSWEYVLQEHFWIRIWKFEKALGQNPNFGWFFFWRLSLQGFPYFEWVKNGDFFYYLLIATWGASCRHESASSETGAWPSLIHMHCWMFMHQSTMLTKLTKPSRRKDSGCLRGFRWARSPACAVQPRLSYSSHGN